MLLYTDRLIIRQAQLEDASFFYTLMNSETWIENIGNRNIHGISEAEDYINDSLLESYKTTGLGLHVVCLKSNSQCIGINGFLQRDYLDCLDIGFAFLPEFMGQGYASESSTKLIEYAANTLKLKRIAAITTSQNERSCRLLRNLNFQQRESIKPKDETLLLFELEPIP